MDTNLLLEQANRAARGSNKVQARRILRLIINKEPRNEAAWLLFADVAQKPKDAVHCLEATLRINPNNEAARKKLALIKAKGRSSKTVAYLVVSTALLLTIACCSGAVLIARTVNLSAISPTEPANGNLPLDFAVNGFPPTVEDFESRNFCLKYRCRRYATNLLFGETTYYHETSLSAGYAEISVSVDSGGMINYWLSLPAADVQGNYDTETIVWEDPKAVFDLLQTLNNSIEITDAMQSEIRENLLQRLPQICEARPIPFGPYQIWIGRVAKYRQDVIIDTGCERPAGG